MVMGSEMEILREIRKEIRMKWGRIKGGKIDIWIEEISDNAWCCKSFSTLQSGTIATCSALMGKVLDFYSTRKKNAVRAAYISTVLQVFSALT
jgi:hypothetical protein